MRRGDVEVLQTEERRSSPRSETESETWTFAPLLHSARSWGTPAVVGHGHLK